MDELAKIGRVVAREGGDACARRTLLVLDATAGHNALQQAREFKNAVPIDGVVLAKIDGTAKGGMVVSLARELRLPVAFLGVGEGAAGPGAVRRARLRAGAARRRDLSSVARRAAQIELGRQSFQILRDTARSARRCSGCNFVRRRRWSESFR